MKTKRIKSVSLATRGEFLAVVDELAQLETVLRGIEAERDAELQAVNIRFDQRMEPIADRIKGKMALATAYADEHRAELLPKDAKSVLRTLAKFGWRTGNRTVRLLSRVTEENAIAALKALGLGAYVRQKEEIARDLILADSKDDKTLTVALGREVGSAKIETKTIALADVGLKIAQSESFYIEPVSASGAAETIKPEANAA